MLLPTPPPQPPLSLSSLWVCGSGPLCRLCAVRTCMAHVPRHTHRAPHAPPHCPPCRAVVVCLRVHVIVWGRGCGIGGGDAALRLSCCVSMSACSFRKKVCAVSPSELSTIGTSIGLQRTFGFTVDKVAKPKRLHLTNGCARCSGVDARPPKPHQACISPLGQPKLASLDHTKRRATPLPSTGAHFSAFVNSCAHEILT